ncbi:MAG: DUF4831 family protein [Bacteroidales bacterium]|nr:DUF4831 family protein [Bacteroidales bacterium]
MRNYTAAVLAAFITTGALAQTVQQVTIGDNFDYGLTYSLPITKIEIKVSAHCTKVVAGEFALYAEKYLGLKDVALEDQTRWEIKQIQLKGVAQADSARTYHIYFSDKAALPTFYFTEERCLWAINQKPEVPQVEKPVAAPVVNKLKFKPSDVMTSDLLKAGSKAKQAELCADEIFSIRESRSDLIRGEADNVPNDGAQLQLMLDNLTAQEEALLSLFVGTTTETDEVRTFSFTPSDEVGRELVFRLSRELGFVEKDDLSGAPYYVGVSIIEDNRMSAMDLNARKKLEKGIAYCIPGKARVQLFNAQGSLAEGDIPMAQFGHVEMLPQGQFTNKKRPCSALFIPSTGAIKLFEQTETQ